MGESARELVRSWLLKASHDLAAAQSLAEPERAILDVAIYLCQQAAEKALKGYLVFHDRRPPRTHDLRSLIAAAAEIDQCFSAWNDAAERLTPYATLYRYPGELVAPDLDQVIEALRDATGIYYQVMGLVPSDIHPGAEETDSDTNSKEAPET
jgi:HEPN domain-containing protein